MDNDGGPKYQCPETGAHFEYMDIVTSMRKLKQRRAAIDKVMEDCDKKR